MKETDTGINLVFLEKLVDELKKSLVLAGQIKAATIEGEIPKEYLIELCKGRGLAQGISDEANLLCGDFKRLVQYATSGAGGEMEALLNKLTTGGINNVPPKTGSGGFNN